MILIADSGSSKTDFALVTSENKSLGFTTSGMSPFFCNSDYMEQEIRNNFPKEVDMSQISAVYFFGTGCSSEDRIGVVFEAFSRCFPDADIEINNDLHGAALATFGNETGIVAILGTGSNSCLWNGNSVIQSTPSLGYILGDEGSGAVLGKRLLKLLLNGDLPGELETQFFNTYDISRNDILDGIYSKPKPNSFMASFSYFWVENLHHPYVQYVVNDCFLAFFEKNICKYPDYENHKMRCVGSIAHFFSDILEECAMAYNIRIDKIIRQPIHELADCFKKNVLTQKF